MLATPTEPNKAAADRNRPGQAAAMGPHFAPRSCVVPSSYRSRAGVFSISLLFLLAVVLAGCASTKVACPARERSFDFGADTFSFANELLWEYSYDAAGHWSTRSREPKPDYTLRCFVLARSTVQFYENARFEPDQPVAPGDVYRKLVRKVVATSLRHELPPKRRITIPGYRNLREFSDAWPQLLKEECGGAWQSYFQRGHWRMIFPFSRHQQQGTAERLLEAVKQHQPVIVHIATFPALTINHAIVLFDARESADRIEFQAYDPNEPAAPTMLRFERQSRTFIFPPTRYFLGGPVHVYRVYHAWNY